MARRARWRMVVALVAGPLAGLQLAVPANAAKSAASWTAGPVQADSTFEAAKSVTGRLAQSDQDLLARNDAAMVSVGVKLDYDASASYAGGVEGLKATSPKVTGRKLTGHSPEEVAYDAYARSMEDGFRRDLAAKVGGATVTRSLRTVYGGVILTLPANEARQLTALKNVVAVQADALNKTLTDSSTAFIGAPTVWAQEGGQAFAGRGVIFADLDSGLWPEHPSLVDNPALGTPPAAPSGQPRACNYGDNPLTAQVDVFQCNSKVIGGQPFLATYNAVVGGEVYPTSARDSDGHGTHTTTTAAGDPVATAKIFGIERGPASGVAPGAWVIEYKVCGAEGCFGSDTAAAAEQAILDGADVINYSISGGSNPYGDITELAFLDAYEAGVFVAASAGNSGPGAGTTDHRSPWVTTVAASTQTREFQSTITLTDGATTATLVGSSVTHGLPSTPVVMASTIPGYTAQCLTVPTAAQAALIAGKIVGCQRGGDTAGRVFKGFRVKGAGAAGMILYNLPLQETETDNHFLPAVHLADGTAFVAFMAAHPGASASFTDGVKAAGQGDVMAAFSSRGPGGQFLKPDITAPGVQILAGNTPTPDAVPAGPSGEYYQAIAGTSMSAPHIAGSALLLKSLHLDWTPGAIKSAMMTTAKTSVVKENLSTPADPFDFGAGRIDLTVAGQTQLVFDESAANMFAKGQNAVTAVQLNLPSVNVPTMPGTVTVLRTATNVTGRDVEFRASATAPAGSRITISPDEGTVRRGRSVTFKVRITSSAPSGQYFGQVSITPKRGPALHLPVAFFNQQGAVKLSSACSPTTIAERATSLCTVTASNPSFADATVAMSTEVSDNLRITGATGASATRRRATAGPVVLAGQKDGTPSIAATTAADTPGGGFLDLALFGVAPTAVGDETIINFNVPSFTYTGRAFTRIGVVSNGYLVVGGGTNADVDFNPQHFPDPTAPNNVLAPYWSDLDGGGSPGIRATTLTDGVDTWIVVQWNVHVFGSAAQTRAFQVWLRVGTVEDVTFSYAGGGLPLAPGNDLNVGAENGSGTGGGDIGFNVAPSSDYRITSTLPVPGEDLSYTLTVQGTDKGKGTVASSMTADIVPGVTRVSTPITVLKGN